MTGPWLTKKPARHGRSSPQPAPVPSPAPCIPWAQPIAAEADVLARLDTPQEQASGPVARPSPLSNQPMLTRGSNPREGLLSQQLFQQRQLSIGAHVAGSHRRQKVHQREVHDEAHLA